MIRRSTFALLLLSSPAFGQNTPPAPPSVTPAPVTAVASIEVPTTPPLVVFGDAAVSKGPIGWKIIAPKGTVFRVYGTALVIPNPIPGTTYRIAQFVTGDVPPIDIDFADVTVPTIAPVPAPPLGPTPDPTPVVPPPAPVPTAFAGHLHATLVYSLDEPSTALLRVSAVKADLKALNCDWYVAPSGGPVATMFAARLATDGLPTVYVTDDAGIVKATIKAPTTEADVLNRVKAIRGTK